MGRNTSTGVTTKVDVLLTVLVGVVLVVLVLELALVGVVGVAAPSRTDTNSGGCSGGGIASGLTVRATGAAEAATDVGITASDMALRTQSVDKINKRKEIKTKRKSMRDISPPSSSLISLHMTHRLRRREAGSIDAHVTTSLTPPSNGPSPAILRSFTRVWGLDFVAASSYVTYRAENATQFLKF